MKITEATILSPWNDKIWIDAHPILNHWSKGNGVYVWREENWKRPDRMYSVRSSALCKGWTSRLHSPEKDFLISLRASGQLKADPISLFLFFIKHSCTSNSQSMSRNDTNRYPLTRRRWLQTSKSLPLFAKMGSTSINSKMAGTIDLLSLNLHASIPIRFLCEQRTWELFRNSTYASRKRTFCVRQSNPDTLKRKCNNEMNSQLTIVIR